MRPESRFDSMRPRIYTDVPAHCILLPSGFLDFDTPCNVIVHREVTELCLPEANTRLCIRCAFKGERRFEASGGQFVVDDSGYLLLNLGQRVASAVQSKTPVELFNITFQPGFAEEVLRSLVTPADRLLDMPKGSACQQVLFFERVYPHDDTLSPLLFRLRERLGREGISSTWLEEQFHRLLEQMLQAHRNVFREVERMPALRQATRAEIYQRLHRARDFMQASAGQPITVGQVAEVACFSPHHFLRLFKQVFHLTPHQYLTRLRLEQAKRLLIRTDQPVTDICYTVGFESVGSFSWLFTRRFGESPSAFRSRSRS